MIREITVFIFLSLSYKYKFCRPCPDDGGSKHHRDVSELVAY
jgi:hypothetical protein